MTIESLESLESLETGYVPVEDSYDGDTYVLRADLPGIDPAKDVDVTLEGDVLTITGERKEETERKTGTRTLHELRYGTFTRRVNLPGSPKTGDVKATYHDGVLEVRVPTLRADHAKKPHHIKVTSLGRTPGKRKES